MTEGYREHNFSLMRWSREFVCYIHDNSTWNVTLALTQADFMALVGKQKALRVWIFIFSLWWDFLESYDFSIFADQQLKEFWPQFETGRTKELWVRNIPSCNPEALVEKAEDAEVFAKLYFGASPYSSGIANYIKFVRVATTFLLCEVFWVLWPYPTVNFKS